jgi:hypothetical protein
LLLLFYCDSANLSLNFGWHACGDDRGTLTGYTVIKKLKQTIVWARSKIVNHKLEQLIEKMISKLSLQQIMPERMQKYGQRRMFQVALIRTYTTWASHNWEWVDSLFNEHFLAQQAGSLLSRLVQEGRFPDSVELAEAWAEQLSWFDQAMRQRHIATLLPAITVFLGCLEEELRAYSLRLLCSRDQQGWSDTDRSRQTVAC